MWVARWKDTSVILCQKKRKTAVTFVRDRNGINNKTEKKTVGGGGPEVPQSLGGKKGFTTHPPSLKEKQLTGLFLERRIRVDAMFLFPPFSLLPSRRASPESLSVVLEVCARAVGFSLCLPSFRYYCLFVFFFAFKTFLREINTWEAILFRVSVPRQCGPSARFRW